MLSDALIDDAPRAGSLGSVDDLTGRRIEDPMVEGLEPNADVLAVHGYSEDRETRSDANKSGSFP